MVSGVTERSFRRRLDRPPRTGTMRNANTLWLNGRTFREDLARALGREVRAPAVDAAGYWERE